MNASNDADWRIPREISRQRQNLSNEFSLRVFRMLVQLWIRAPRPKYRRRAARRVEEFLEQETIRRSAGCLVVYFQSNFEELQIPTNALQIESELLLNKTPLTRDDRPSAGCSKLMLVRSVNLRIANRVAVGGRESV